MDTTTAQALVSHVGELTRLCATYQAELGRGYRVKPGSGERAWTLYNAIVSKQVAIGELLSRDALEKPRVVLNKWWDRQDVPDLSITTEMIQEVSRLIACCAYIEAEAGTTDWSYAVFCSQAVIAGTLHPSALQMALGNQEGRYAV